jgi:nitrogen-specific signal transduction histidine kinase
MNKKDMEEIEEILHKINSPLSTVIGYSQLLERSMDKGNLSEKEKKWARSLVTESLRIKDLMQKLSDAVRKSG